MRTVLWLAGIAVIAFGGYYLVTHYSSDVETPMPEQKEKTIIEVFPIEHASGILRWNDTAIYFDPVAAEAFVGKPPAHIILVTDIHGDHLSPSTLAALMGTTTTLIVPEAVKDQLPADLAAQAKVLANGASISEQGLTITAVPMYNLPDAENKDRHVKGRGNGYVIEKSGTRVYIAGDTAGTPEMRSMPNIYIAFVPMNMPYTMSVEEAADAVLEFKPRIVYHYHYRSPDGLADVAKFKQLVNAGDPSINVMLGAWYPAE